MTPVVDVSPLQDRPVARSCAWCRGPIPLEARRDAITCSKRCRQARHRFVTAVGSASPVVGGHPRRLAYADPPYPGKAWLYRDHPDYGGEVDHAALVASLAAEYDAWALSTSAEALQSVLAVCPPGVRVASWHRGERPHPTAGLPLNGWEPVIYAGQIIRRASIENDVSRADPRPVEARSSDASREYSVDTSCRPGADESSVDERRVDEDLLDVSCGSGRRVDSLVFASRPRLTDPDRVIGAKPATFCRWLFELLGAQRDDVFVDVFPGSGGVARAWEVYAAAKHDTSRPAVARDDVSRRAGASRHPSPGDDRDASRSTSDATQPARAD